MSMQFEKEKYEIEPIPGLPEPLPKGENILWQGRPQRGLVLRNVLHIRMFAIYFAVILAWNVGTSLYDGKPASDALAAGIGTILLGAAFYALAALFAFLVERTTIYTLTDKRVVMRCGVALSIAFQFPFSQITSADVRSLRNGAGDIAFTLKENTRISWFVLWPHVRAWKLAKPQPTLRCIDNVADIAQMMAEGLRTAHGVGGAAQRSQAVPTKPVHAPQPAAPIQPGFAQSA